MHSLSLIALSSLSSRLCVTFKRDRDEVSIHFERARRVTRARGVHRARHIVFAAAKTASPERGTRKWRDKPASPTEMDLPRARPPTSPPSGERIFAACLSDPRHTDDGWFLFARQLTPFHLPLSRIHSSRSKVTRDREKNPRAKIRVACFFFFFTL